MHYGTGYGGGMYMWIILLIVIGVGAYFFIQHQKVKGQTPTQQTTQNENHLDILKKRYAKGEIAKEEYEKMKTDLEG
ncbi:MAG: SHOCT domain-containing protein [Anaerolineaceae bacterium]|nr:MAG: SHOCT domain-containing protein [Anaerolineaceae bacterium]